MFDGRSRPNKTAAALLGGLATLTIAGTASAGVLGFVPPLSLGGGTKPQPSQQVFAPSGPACDAGIQTVCDATFGGLTVLPGATIPGTTIALPDPSQPAPQTAGSWRNGAANDPATGQSGYGVTIGETKVGGATVNAPTTPSYRSVACPQGGPGCTASSGFTTDADPGHNANVSVNGIDLTPTVSSGPGTPVATPTLPDPIPVTVGGSTTAPTPAVNPGATGTITITTEAATQAIDLRTIAVPSMPPALPPVPAAAPRV
jgi:hypothetical protein